jgi:hypothetical protein
MNDKTKFLIAGALGFGGFALGYFVRSDFTSGPSSGASSQRLRLQTL